MIICPSCMVGSYGTPDHCPGCGASLHETVDRAGTDLGGMVIQDKYELTDFISEGAMGWVYRGVHRSLQSTIAVKLMKPAAEPDPTRDKRFEREARAASALNNPHIISIIDFGRTPGGVLYIVSEYLRGLTLSELVAQQGPLPVPRALRVVDQILSAVYEAHEAALIHRDMKPDNVIITPLRSGEDFVKVLDFGIAKLGDDQSQQRLTMQGQLFGTPAYMSPEQIRGQEVTPRTDLYACAAILYELLTGREPFISESVMEVLSMQLHTEPPSFAEAAPERDDIPIELEEVVMRGLAKDPSARYADAAEFRQALGPFAGRRRQITTTRCSSCGHPMQLGSKFCPECGMRKSQLGMPAVDEAQAQAQAMGPTTSEVFAVQLHERQQREVQATGANLPVTEETPAQQPPRPGSDASAALEGVDRRSTLHRRLSAEKTLRFELVGRDAEIERLSGALERGERLVEIVGAMGSGRTSLLNVVEQLAERAGLKVLRAGPDPGLTRTPWYPVHQLVRQLLEMPGESPQLNTLQQSTIHAGLVANDLPGMAELFGISHLTGRVEYAVRQREVRAAATRSLLQSRQAATGLCLLLDDVDEFDSASRALVRVLATADAPGPLLIVTTSEKPMFADPGDAMVLEPLQREQAQTMFTEVQQQLADTSGDVVDTVLQHSEGLPLHITQAVRLLAEGGTEIDASPADVLMTRIGRLPGDSLRLLQTLSVIGRRAPFELVQRLYQGSDQQLPGALRLLERRGFAALQDDSVLVVSHPFVAESVREAMPADARRKLHIRAHALLEERGAGAISLARHALEAQESELALDLLQKAGKQAESWLDDAGAAYHFRQALQVARWQLLYEEHQDVCLDLSLHLGETLRFSGDSQGAQLVLKDALLGSENHPDLNARLLRTLAWVYVDTGDSKQAMNNMQRAVRSAILAGAPEVLNEMYIELGKLLARLGEWDRVSEELTEGVLLVTSGDGPEAGQVPPNFWRLLGQLADAKLELNLPAEAVNTAYAALRQAEREQSLIGQARCHHQLCQLLDGLDKDGPAEEHHTAAVAAFRRLGDRRSTAECLISHASKRPRENGELLQEALELATQVNWTEGIRAITRMNSRVMPAI